MQTPCKYTVYIIFCYCNQPESENNFFKAGVTQLLWDNESCGGSWLYTACLDNIARIWDARTGTLVENYSGHQDSIYSIAISWWVLFEVFIGYYLLSYIL